MLVLVASVVLVPLASAVSQAPPVLRVGGSTVEATGPGGAVATYTVKADDPSTGPLPATCDFPAGTAGTGNFAVSAQFPLGTTVVTCTTTDSGGAVWTKSAQVLVQDTTAPSIAPTANIATTTTNASGTIVQYTVPTATDAVDGTDPVNCAPVAGTNFPLGTTTVTCSSTDAHQNTARSNFTVTVIQTGMDTTPPVVTVPAAMTVTALSASGAVVTYAASAVDNVDGTLIATCTPASGSTFPIGTTTVTCSATDTAGNTGAASFTVTVSLTDTTPPVVTVPSAMTVNATSASGAVVSYTASAVDNVDGQLPASCMPASGALFPVGTTTVTCSATDAHGNRGTASFTVTVSFTDTTPPVFSGVPANVSVEANAPSGSTVTYSVPTATDAVDGPIANVACSPASGSLFALGATTVTCSATDLHNNTATTSFSVAVVDTTSPTLLVPADASVYADTSSGIGAQGPAAAAFLASATAADIVDPHPVVTNDAPAFLGVGPHVIMFSARDASGNSVSKSAVLTVLAMPPVGTTPPPAPVPPPQRRLPTNVDQLKAEAGDGRVRLSWKKPADVDHVAVTRSLPDGSAQQVVYDGSAESFTDKGVVNGVEYRYLVVSVASDGVTSAGVVVLARPKRSLLKAPKDGAKLRAAPKLVWLQNAEASYYNVQLFRGDVKILSAWPVRATLLLKKQWTYSGKKYRLSRGSYRWYVWPGFGARPANDYGEMLGFSNFEIIR